MMIREAVKFAGTAAPLTLAAYDDFAFSDPIDCENFLQVCFELYPDTVVGGLYYTLEFMDDAPVPASDAGWLPDPMEGAPTVVANDSQVAVTRLVRIWTGTGPIQVNSPVPARWCRIGLAAGTSGEVSAIVKRVRLAAQ